MDPVLIRRAHLDDREALCSLYHEFHEFHVRGVPERLLTLGAALDTYEDSDLVAALEEIINGDGSDIFVAESAGRLVGFAEVYVREDGPNPLRISRRYAYLQSMMVCEQVRRQGIGTLLLQSVHAWAKARECMEIRAETWEFEAGPLPFYQRQRYRTPRRTLVHKF